MLKQGFLIGAIVLLLFNIFCLNRIEIIKENIKNKEAVEVVKEKKTTKKAIKLESKYDYIGVLEIKSLGISRGFVAPDSKYNNIRYNIQIIEGSTMPDVKNGNFILAAHRGTAKVAFFNNLHEIEEGALITVYYNDKVYNYEFVKSYDVEKNGKLAITRDALKTTITLITCKKNTNLQTIFIGYMINDVK